MKIIQEMEIGWKSSLVQGKYSSKQYLQELNEKTSNL